MTNNHHHNCINHRDRAHDTNKHNNKHTLNPANPANPNEIDIDIQPHTQLSEIGQLAEKFWQSIPEHFPFVKLGAFVGLPNHVHGILIIDTPNDGIETPTGNCEQPEKQVETGPVETGQCPVSTNPNPSNPNPTTNQKTPGELRIRKQGKDTGSFVIESYKPNSMKSQFQTVPAF